MNSQISEKFYNHVQELDKCSDISQIKIICDNYLKSIGIRFFKYTWTPPTVNLTSEPITFFTCPEAWINRYITQGYATNDPKIRYCREYRKPIEWNPDILGKRLVKNMIPPSDIIFWQDLLDINLAIGASIPIWGIGGSTGMFCVVYENSYIKHELSILPILEAWAMYIHSQVERLHTDQQLSSPLSNREQDILKWTVIGKTADEISDILKISHNTVLFHLTNLRQKLNVSNKHHLIARTLSLHLIRL